MQYSELKQTFIDHEANQPEHHLTGQIVFTKARRKAPAFRHGDIRRKVFSLM